MIDDNVISDRRAEPIFRSLPLFLFIFKFYTLVTKVIFKVEISEFEIAELMILYQQYILCKGKQKELDTIINFIREESGGNLNEI